MADENILGAHVTIDSDGIEQGSQKYIDALGKMEEATSDLAQSTESATNAINESLNAVSTEDSQKSVDELGKAIDDLTARIDNEKMAVNNANAEIVDLKQELNSTKEQYDELGKSVGAANMSTSELTDTIARAKEEIAAQNDGIASNNERIAELTEKNRELGATYSELEARMQAAYEAGDVGWVQSQYNSYVQLGQAIKDNADEIRDLTQQNQNARAIISENEQVIADTEPLLEKRKTYEELGEQVKETSDKIAELKNTVDSSKSTISDANIVKSQATERLKEMKQGIDEANESTKSFSLSSSQLNSLIKSLPAPLQSVITGIKGMTTASLEFIATPIGAVIGAVAIALASVSKFLTSTVEGQKEMTKVTGLVNGVLGQCAKWFAALGEKLWKYGEKVVGVISKHSWLQKVLKGLGAVIIGLFPRIIDNILGGIDILVQAVDFLITRFEHVFELIKSAFVNTGDALLLMLKGDFAGAGKALAKTFVDGFKNEWNDAKDFGKLLLNGASWFGKLNNPAAIVDAYKQGKQLLNDLSESVSTATDVAEKELKLQAMSATNKVEMAKKEQEIADLRLKIMQTNDKAEKARLAKMWENLVDEKTALQFEEDNLRLAINLGKLKYTPSSVGDYANVLGAGAKLIRTETSGMMQKRMAARFGAMSERADEAAAKAAERAAKAEAKRQAAAEKRDTKSYNTITLAEDKLNQFDVENERKRLDTLRQLNEKATDLALSLISDRSEKERAKREEAHKRELEELNRQQEELMRAEIEAQRKRFYMEETLKAEQDPNYKKRTFEESDINYSPINDIKNAFATLYSLTQQKHLGEDFIANFKSEIDWETVFGDLESVSTEKLQSIKEQLKATFSSGNLDVEAYKEIGDAIQKIEETLRNRKDSWKDIFKNAVPELEKMKQLQEDAINAAKTFEEQQMRLNAMFSQSDTLVGRFNAIAASNGVTTPIMASTSQADVEATINSIDNSSVAETLANIWEAIKALNPQIANQQGIVSEAKKRSDKADEAQKVYKDDFTNKLNAAIGVADMVNANVQSLPELMNTLGVDENSAFAKGVKSFADSSAHVTAGMKDLASGNFVGALNNAMLAVGSLTDAVGITGESDPHLLEDLERLSETNENLRLAIDNLTTEMSDADFTKVGDIYEQGIKNLESLQRNTMEQMARSAAAYKSGISGKHSSNRKIDDALTALDWQAVSAAAGRSVNGSGDFWTLTSEEMYKVATYATAQYNKIKRAADDGYRDAAQFMDDYIGIWEQLDEFTDAWYDKTTGYTFDEMKQNFRSLIADMDASMSDFTDNFDEMVKNIVLDSIISNTQFTAQLKDWQEKFALAVESGSKLSLKEKQALYDEGKKIYEDMLNARNEQYQQLGISNESVNYEATRKSVANISQDTGDAIVGRITAIDYTNTQQLGQLTEQTSILRTIDADMHYITEYQRIQQEYVSEIRDIQMESVGLLNNIDKNTRNLYDMRDSLSKIEKKVSNL